MRGHAEGRIRPEGPGQAGEGPRANLMEFNKAKGKVLPVSRGNPRHKPSLGTEGMGSSPKEKDLGVLGGWKTACEPATCAHSPESHPCAGLHPEQCGQQGEWGGFSPSAPLCETPLQCWVQLWGHQQQKDTDLLERGLLWPRGCSGGWSTPL